MRAADVAYPSRPRLILDDMERARLTPAEIADAAAVTEIVGAVESSLYGGATFSQADLEDEWSDLELERDARVARDGERIVGYGAVHPDRPAHAHQLPAGLAVKGQPPLPEPSVTPAAV